MTKLSSSLMLAVLLSITSAAQPFKASLSGSVILEQSREKAKNLQPTLYDFRFKGSTESNSNGNPFIDASRTKPGIALLSSAIIPGSGQAINGKWGRAAAYFLVDVASLVYYVDRNNTAKRNERSYQRYANQNWSVLAYAQWLVAYSEANGINNGYEQLATQIFGETPDFSNTTNDWAKVDIDLVRAVELETPFYFPNSVASNFSHLLQDYGSQQYYELMSKYYQFQPGWRDFHEDRVNDPTHVYRYPWNSTMITPNFIEGRDRAFEFNDNYRQAGNILKLMLVNHVVSAFDAYFTVKLKNSRIEPSANLLEAETFSVTWHF